MEYTLPTTKQEMYTTLNEIFRFYRTDTQDYTDVTLLDLELTRMNVTFLSDEQLLEKAAKIMAASQQEKITARQDDIKKEITSLNAKTEKANDELKKEKEKLFLQYQTKLQTLSEKFLDGQYSESTYFDDRAAAEKDYLLKTEKAENETQTLNLKIQNKIDELNQSYNAINEYFAELFLKEKEQKFIELKDEQDKLERQVFKYNNLLDEKEQRYANTVKQTEAALKLRKLALKPNTQTKEELIESGYYGAVIDVVSAYYDTLDAESAMQDIKKEKKLMIYLDEFYDDFLYMYYMRTVHVDIS